VRLLLPGLVAREPGLESYRVRPGGVTALRMEPGDRLTVIDSQGRQAAEVSVLSDAIGNGDGRTLSASLDTTSTPGVNAWELIVTGVGSDGTRYVVDAGTILSSTFTGSVWDWVVVVARDITARREAEGALQHQALHDPLTSLPNRLLLHDRIERAVAAAGRDGHSAALMLLDVDHFKEVNDRFGHAAGDAVLRHLGCLLRRHFRGEDVVARWGGEEFVVGLYGMSRADGVHRVAEVLEAFRCEDFSKDGVVGSLTFTAGVAEYKADGRDLRSLYHAADYALYRAKAAGRDRVVPAGWSGPELETGVDVVVVEGDAAAVAPLLIGLQTRGYRARWLRTVEEGARLLAGPKAALSPEVVLLGAGAAELDGLADRAATITMPRDADVVDLLHEVRRALSARTGLEELR